MQLSRSQFQGHPKLGVCALSAMAGITLGTYGQEVINWVEIVVSNPQLLAAVEITPYGHKAILNLITMINSLPEGNTVLEFILANLQHTFVTTASVVNGKIVPDVLYNLPNISTVPNEIIQSVRSGGTYLFQHVDTLQQYIGSSCNLSIRLSGHLSQFNGSLPPFTFHNVVNSIGELDSVQWGYVYQTFQFTNEFQALHPNLWISQGELQILKAFSQFLPRLLEQSLFSFTPEFNHEALIVYFDYVRFDPSTLTIFEYDLGGAKPVDVYNFITGEHMIRLASVSAASIYFFGSKLRRHVVRKHIGALSGMKWSAKDASTPRVMVTHPGVPLIDQPVVHRIEHQNGPLVIPNMLLTSLEFPWIYIYTSNFNFIGRYSSYSSAIQALSPLLTAGLTSKQAEVKSRGLQRACNWDMTANTEVGNVYVARHPSLVKRKKAT